MHAFVVDFGVDVDQEVAKPRHRLQPLAQRRLDDALLGEDSERVG